MKTWLTPLAVLVALLPAAGCTLYTGGDDTGDDGCTDIAAEGLPLRNPQTGECEYFGGGGGGGCYGYGSEDDQPSRPTADQALPYWAQCY